MSEEPSSTYDAFISHASDDADAGTEVCDHLEAKGHRCWIAPRDVRAGHSWGSSRQCLQGYLCDTKDANVTVKIGTPAAQSRRARYPHK